MTEIKDGIMGWHEATGLMVTAIAGKVFLTVPQDLAARGSTAGWAIAVISTILGLLGFAIITRLLERFPGRTIVEATEEVFGPYLGVLLSLGYFAFFILFNVLILRAFVETVLTTVLPLTPVSVVMGLLMVGIVYCAYQGLEPLSRGAWLVVPFMGLGYMGIIAGVIPYFHHGNLFPLLGAGPAQIAASGALKSSLFGEILFLAVIAPAMRNMKDLKKAGYTAIMISGIIIVLTTVVYIGVFGIPGAISSGTNPMFQMARLILLGRFVQRIESLFIFIWVFVALIKLSVGLYGSAATMARILKLPVFRPLLFPLALLIYTMAFIPQSWAVVNRIENQALRSFGWLLTFFLPAVVLLVAKIRGKTGLQARGEGNDRSQ